jgi:hypothetical protein
MGNKYCRSTSISRIGTKQFLLIRSSDGEKPTKNEVKKKKLNITSAELGKYKTANTRAGHCSYQSV